ncbi:TetR family transcriptional regulator [Octadecabacter antarcticus 307]|uniref:TetR family transcriptional regulator n=1 Tax=Octadecabacter antarcticus 307 TaxID=391626 RepID=M9RA30_9RHOB|nr:TetR/AcrR family transcriptional regulator [Octadecabacter antarcticus]AGI68668.1 TetR family transcriptional regulator [Octadecabacter antarcticus 307]
MAGIRRFDTEKALDSAMRVFWRKGFDATSIDDLTDATGLGRGSLYGAFTDKETLFLTVLERYLEKSRQKWLEALEHPDVRTAIENALNVLINTLTAECAEPGCFLLMASMNGDERTHKIRRRVLKAFAEEEAAIYTRLRQAEKDGQFPEDQDPLKLARFYVAQGRAIGLTARWSSDPEELREIARTSVILLS